MNLRLIVNDEWFQQSIWLYKLGGGNELPPFFMKKSDYFILRCFCRTGITVLFLLITILEGFSQSQVWIFFTDKGENPQPGVSYSSLLRRMEKNIPLDQRDFQVSPEYLQILKNEEIFILTKSRWLNAVLAVVPTDKIFQISRLPFVNHMQVPRMYQIEVAAKMTSPGQTQGYFDQLEMIGLDQLHLNGYIGQGITVAMFDNGFGNVDSLEGFEHMFLDKRMIAGYDFVDNDEDVFEDCSRCRHGTQVLSVLAALMPGQLTGAAPGARYILLRTEDSYREVRSEEALFVEAAEFADSIGADIFNLSYGYRLFDPGEGDYGFADLDGETSLITKAADIAASRGILVFASVGNYGPQGIQAPADGDSVIAVGAVNEEGELYASSSRGPSGDGRIKPELVAMGEGTRNLLASGDMKYSNGTSFSSPLIAGLAACLWSAKPHASWGEMYDGLLQSGSQYDVPDNSFGYGIPDGRLALNQLAGPISDNSRKVVDPFARKSMILFPNPSKGNFTLALKPGSIIPEAEIEILDLEGRKVFSARHSFSLQRLLFYVKSDLTPGYYVLNLTDHNTGEVRFLEKLVILPD